MSKEVRDLGDWLPRGSGGGGRPLGERRSAPLVSSTATPQRTNWLPLWTASTTSRIESITS
jgi:hypothetical protein